MKYRYLRCVDLEAVDDLAEVFHAGRCTSGDYGTMVYGRPLKLTRRDEIIGFLRDKLGPEMITVHSAGQPEISIDGDEATGTWSFEDTVFATAHRVMIKGAAFYQDRSPARGGRPLADRAYRVREHLRGDSVPRRPAELPVHGDAGV